MRGHSRSQLLLLDRLQQHWLKKRSLVTEAGHQILMLQSARAACSKERKSIRIPWQALM